MKRDRRLLLAIMLFVGSAAAWLVEAVIVSAYIHAAVMGDWAHFAQAFSIDTPFSGPDKFCFDYCAPKLPFAAGWIGIFGFLGGLFALAYSWWKSKGEQTGVE